LGAAAGYLDRPVTTQVVVVQVLPGSAAAGVLEAGDVILAVDSDPIRDREQLVTQVRASPPGTTFRFRIKRSGEVQTVAVTTRLDPDDPESALVGIVPENRYRSDFTATVNLDGIGGPSAGLMLAVGMVDKLTPGDLLLGRRVAGTGTIDGEGDVGAIGGIDKKMLAAREAGAELFIAPKDNCADVAASQPDGLQVAAVDDLDQTMKVLADWRENLPVLGCPRTGDE
jgi:PDZ domain-containing protein